MGEAAIKAAKVTNYHSTGTVEFLYQDGEFFLLRNEYEIASRAWSYRDGLWSRLS